MEVTKEQAAIIQLCDAIELFNKKRYISALTLSAASEEVLAKILKNTSSKAGKPLF
jgi:hypothetical protein